MKCSFMPSSNVPCSLFCFLARCLAVVMLRCSLLCFSRYNFLVHWCRYLVCFAEVPSLFIKVCIVFLSSFVLRRQGVQNGRRLMIGYD